MHLRFPQTAQYVQQLFSNDRLRVYTSKDIRGVELGGSIKNVVAIAAGFWMVQVMVIIQRQHL
ncbi:MAG: hypothetical protein Ct9H300mP2_4550 [Candidatus Neomarinimicrobiota bacterium]|nr:MAG: hypothetical protein Ct9H300mP2_4550 [Candidatus Neomarinimicrobiota bacterium]